MITGTFACEQWQSPCAVVCHTSGVSRKNEILVDTLVDILVGRSSLLAMVLQGL